MAVWVNLVPLLLTTLLFISSDVEARRWSGLCTAPNQRYSKCGNNACQNTCAEPNKCEDCSDDCISGCVCRRGYLKNANGDCVRPKDCNPPGIVCTGPNEQFTTCLSPCGERCSNLGQDITCNFLVCNPGCECKPGFFRDDNNVCVPPEKCVCKANEELDLCYNNCPPRTCSAIGKAFKCAPPTTCKPACKCAFNYRRDADGICIPVENCPPLTCTNPNEVYNPCPPDCLDERCESMYDPLFCTAQVRECQPRCVCKDGYLRDSNGVCIPALSCKCPDPNQEVVSCPNPCPGGTCESPAFAPCKVACRIRGCQCKSGYVKDANGKCILLSQCPGQPKSCTTPNVNPLCKKKDYVTVRVKKCKHGQCQVEYLQLKKW